jgi:hypothetical protein
MAHRNESSPEVAVKENNTIKEPPLWSITANIKKANERTSRPTQPQNGTAVNRLGTMAGTSSEEAAELVATIRGEHAVMKAWYNGSASKEAAALRDRYGPYPGLWKEVLNWPGWREARKAYLKVAEGGDHNGTEAKKGEEEATDTAATTTTASSTAPESGEGTGRKRRSRWGAAEDNGGGGNNNQDGGGGNDEAANKRRSRWGRDEGASAPGAAGSGSIPPPPPPPLQGLGGVPPPPSAGQPMPLPLPPLPGLGLPGMPANLSPQQQQEMAQWQARLREINEKIDKLEQEAARVDALPRGHRERSPSPPPGPSCESCQTNDPCCVHFSCPSPSHIYHLFLLLV